MSSELETLPEDAADYRPDKYSLSNAEVMATGILGQGAVLNIAKELVSLRKKIARLRRATTDVSLAWNRGYGTDVALNTLVKVFGDEDSKHLKNNY